MISSINEGQRSSNCQGNIRTRSPSATVDARSGHFSATIPLDIFPFNEIEASSMAAPKWIARKDWNVWLHVIENESSDPFVTVASCPAAPSAARTFAAS